MAVRSKLRRWRNVCAESSAVFVRDVGQGLLEVCHNSLALLGLCVVAALLFAGTRADMRHSVEQHALQWLMERHEVRGGSAGDDPSDPANPAAPSAVDRATATDPSALPRQQADVATWLSRRYKVAPEPLSSLVQEAWSVGKRMGIEPTLVLAVMAIESNFNPFAQSPVGAQGLMQVMTRIHNDKYQAFGGARAAFDPITNLRVGVQVLKECIARAGGLEAGLRHYVGAASHGNDGGYVGKVLAEQAHLRKVSEGRRVPVNAPLPVFRAEAIDSATDRTSTPALAASQPVATDALPHADPERVALLR